MKRYQITLGDRTYDVKILSDAHKEQVQVEVDGEILTVRVSTVPVAEGITQVAPAPAAVPASSMVTSPLPGVIKSIRVQPGQRVSIDDELVVIEAMKMDNIIRAPRTGTVGIIHVTEGRQVAHGEPLLSIGEKGQGFEE
jgi:biotin carboxyl carrier protein